MGTFNDMIDADTYFLDRYLDQISADEHYQEQLQEWINNHSVSVLSTIKESELLRLFGETYNDDQPLIDDLVVQVNIYFTKRTDGNAQNLGRALAAFLEAIARRECEDRFEI